MEDADQFLFSFFIYFVQCKFLFPRTSYKKDIQSRKRNTSTKADAQDCNKNILEMGMIKMQTWCWEETILTFFNRNLGNDFELDEF